MKKRALFAAMGTTLALATAAFAQPAVFTDLGSITNPSVTTGTLTGFTAGQVQWLKVTVPSTIRGFQQFFDITLNGGTFSSVDTHMGIFDNAGTFLVLDDDSGPSNYSQLSFGDNAPARSAIPFSGNATANGGTRAGVNGASLPAGTYWIAVTGFGGNAYANGWNVTTTHVATGDVAYRLELGSDPTPATLAVTGAATGIAPAASPYMNGEQVRITATVTPFNGPPINTNLTVTANLSAIGGAAVQTLFDDGTNGDLVAGDLTYSYVQTISGGVAGTTTGSMAINVNDDAAHTATATVTGLAITRYGNLGTPATFTDLGTWSCSGNSSGFTHVDGGASGPWGDRVRWYKIVLPAAVAGASTGSYVDLFTSNVGSAITDPEFAIFDNAGVKIAEDDQDGAGSHAAVSFGQTTPNRTAQGDGVAHNGRDGALAGGTYWIAVGDFNMNFPATGLASGNFRVTSNDTTTTAGLLNLEVRAVSPSCTTPPTGVGSYTPTATVAVGGVQHFKVVVTPGTSPVSTGMGVTVDGSLIGAGTITLLDDGLSGDGAANDNEFGADVTVTAAGGTYTLPFTVTDGQARSSNGNMPLLTVVPPAPSCPPGSGAASLTNINSGGAVGSVDNTIIPAASLNWTSTDPLLNIHVSGRLSEVNLGTFSGEANFRVNFADSSFVMIDPFAAGAGFTGFVDVADFSVAIPAGQSPSTVTSIEAWESFDDGAGIDATWNNLCFTYDLAVFTPPVGTGTGGSVAGCGGNVLATVAVTPGGAPTSTGITVSLDTTALGGGSVAMLDNGTGGDVTAGDNIFSATVAVGGGADAVFALPFTVSDAQARSSGGSLNVTRSGTEIGDLPASAQKYYGLTATSINGSMVANDADMFAICINDVNTFQATTIGGPTAFDSQLFLFNADGTGALMSDDDTTVAGFSLINAAAAANPDYDLVSGGLYYIAVSAYNKDPITSGVATDTIWANQNNIPNFLGTYGPNGVTPTAPIAGWTTGGTTVAAYTISLTGATTICPADLSSGTAGVPDCAVDINDLLYFLGAFEAGNADIDNGSGTGALDCATDINDLLFFLARFEAGC